MKNFDELTELFVSSRPLAKANKKSPIKGGFFNGASIEAFFEPFREMNIEELYATALQIQDFFDRHPHMKRDLY